MAIENSTVTVETSCETDIINITGQIERHVSRLSAGDGLVLVFIAGSTAALTTIEYESGVVRDLAQAIERIAPRDIAYDHDKRWADGNGYAHVRAALLGPSLAIPLIGGRMHLGTWQQIVLCDFDNRPRMRDIFIQVYTSE